MTSARFWVALALVWPIGCQAVIWGAKDTAHLMMEGAIVPGDAARLGALLQKMGQPTPLRVHLQSPGGDVNESYAIGRILRRHRAIVTHGVCASACVFVFLGGSERITQEATSAAALVIHRPAGCERARSIPTEQSHGVLRELKNYTIEMLRSSDFHDAMVQVPFEQPSVLMAREAIAWGVANRLSP
jgi:hypothetical protein